MKKIFTPIWKSRSPDSLTYSKKLTFEGQLQQRYFPVDVAEFLRTVFLKNILGGFLCISIQIFPPFFMLDDNIKKTIANGLLASLFHNNHIISYLMVLAILNKSLRGVYWPIFQ